MARLPRLAVGGHVHLVVQRGHNDQPVFVDDDDRQALLELLRSESIAHAVAVHGYALLDSEIRLLLTPMIASGLSLLMQALARRHGVRFNRRHGHVGTLWSGRFRAAVVDPAGWVVTSLRFVEAAGQPRSRWSSAGHHLGDSRDAMLSEHPAYWSLGNTPFEREAIWAGKLEQPLTSAETASIGKALRGGWPLGADRFRAELAKLVDRRLAPVPAGRPVSRPDQSVPVK